MQISAECRWFWRAENRTFCADILDWFKNPDLHGCLPGGGELRVDEYLADTKQSELSIKRRGKKPGVEVKGLVRRTRTDLTITYLTAPIEIWGKWTSEVLSVDSLTTVKIEKKRWLRKFEITRDPDVREQIPLGKDEMPLDGRSLPATGCNVELTYVKTRDYDDWVTFGLEAFGEFDAIEYAIQMASVEMTSSEARFHLGGNPDFIGSYALWLNGLNSH